MCRVYLNLIVLILPTVVHVSLFENCYCCEIGIDVAMTMSCSSGTLVCSTAKCKNISSAFACHFYIILVFGRTLDIHALYIEADFWVFLGNTEY